MNKKITGFLLTALFLCSCVPHPTSSSVSYDLPTPDALASETPAQVSSARTPTSTPTATLDPAPDYMTVGLPSEPAGAAAYDFATRLCEAEWYLRDNVQWYAKDQVLPCPGNENQGEAGYVTLLDGSVQGLSSDLGILLTNPPHAINRIIFSRYPAFTVQKGDRFRAVLACRAHTFCDVEFALGYYNDHGHAGLMHWRYLFADPPIIVDLSLDGLAGKTIQFDLSAQVKGNRTDTGAVWIAPHIVRPVR